MATEKVRPVEPSWTAVAIRVLQLLFLPAAAVIKRETMAYMRQWRTVIWLGLLVGVGIAVALTGWPEEGVRVAAGGANSMSRNIFFSLAYVFLGGCLLFVPPVAAGAIAGERQRDTLGQLSVTLIRPSTLLAAKIFGAMCFFLILLLAFAPVFGTVFFLPGIDTLEFTFTLVTIFGAAAGCAALGLAASSMAPNTTLATILAYGGVFVFQLGAFSIVASIHRSGADSAALPLTVFLGYQGFLAVVAALVSRALLRFYVHKTVRTRDKRVIDNPWLLRKRKTTYPFYLIDPLRRKKPLTDTINPVLLREVFWGMTGSVSNLVRISYVAVCFFLLGAAMATMFRDWFWDSRTWIAVEMATVVLAVPPFLAGAFTKEHEVGNLDMLRLTLVRPRQIVIGKTLGNAVCPLSLAAAAFLSCVLLVVLDYHGWPVVVQGFVSLLVAMAYASACTVLVSVLVRKTATAIILSYVLTVGLIGVAPGALGLALDEVSRMSGNELALVSAFVSPFSAYAFAHKALEVGDLYWVLNVLAFAIISWLIFWGATALFRARRLKEG